MPETCSGRAAGRPSPWGFVLQALLVAATGCGREPSVAVIGYVTSSSRQAAVSVARDEIAELPAAGPDIRITYDSMTVGAPADAEVALAQRTIGVEGLVAVVGHGGSRGSLVAAPVYNSAGVSQIVPIATSRLLKRAGPWTLTLAPDDSVEGAFIARFVAGPLRARRVSVFYLNDEYGFGIRDGVIAALRGTGVEVLSQVPLESDSDLETLVDASLIAGRPDVVISATRWREASTIANLAQRHVTGLRVVAADGALALPGLVQRGGPADDSVYVVAFWSPDAPDPASRAYVTRFQRVVGRPPLGSEAMAHDALMLLAHAVRDVGANPEAVHRYLLSLGRQRPPFPGVTGPISFQPNRQPPLVMVRMTAGRPVRVEGYR